MSPTNVAGEQPQKPDRGVIGDLTQALFGDSIYDSEASERQNRRAEYRSRLASIQQTAITFAVVIAAVLLCAMAFECWRILHEVTL